MRTSVSVLILLLVGALSGCGSSKTSVTRGAPLDEPVRAVGMAPSGGVFADAIAVSLFNQGLQVVDTNQMSSLLIRLNLNEMEIMEPRGLKAVRDAGIDVVLSVRAVGGYDGKPQSASVRLNSTKTGEIIAGLSWQNGWGGQAGSMADRMKRKDLAEAADQIARELVKSLPHR